jgi:hypothetical protein
MFDATTMPARLEALTQDPWDGFWKIQQGL